MINNTIKKNFLLSMLTMIMVAVQSVCCVSCGSDDDNGSLGNSALVGIWTKDYYHVGVIGIKLTSDGKAYYNEWDAREQPDFSNVVIPYDAKVTSNTLRISHSHLPGYYEEYSYVLSEDGKSVTFTLIDWKEDNHGLNGTFIKVQ